MTIIIIIIRIFAEQVNMNTWYPSPWVPLICFYFQSQLKHSCEDFSGLLPEDLEVYLISSLHTVRWFESPTNELVWLLIKQRGRGQKKHKRGRGWEEERRVREKEQVPTWGNAVVLCFQPLLRLSCGSSSPSDFTQHDSSNIWKDELCCLKEHTSAPSPTLIQLTHCLPCCLGRLRI